jgi:hypothetical protein
MRMATVRWRERMKEGVRNGGIDGQSYKIGVSGRQTMWQVSVVNRTGKINFRRSGGFAVGLRLGRGAIAACQK